MKVGAVESANRNPKNSHAEQQWPRWLRVGFWFCTVIAVAVVLRRLIALEVPSQSGPPQLVALDAWFASHAPLALAHILPALAFVLLTPLVSRDILPVRYGPSDYSSRSEQRLESPPIR